MDNLDADHMDEGDIGMADYEEDLIDSVIKNDLDGVVLLLNATDVDVNKLNKMSKAPLFIALENENIEMVRVLMEHNADINQASYCHMYCTYETPIVTAARLLNMDIVEMLLDEGCELETTSAFREGKTALQWAATHGNIDMAHILYSKGADVNWIGMYFHTALHYATIGDKTDMVAWLLEKGAENGVNGDGRSPLHIAAVRGNFHIVKLLLGANCPMDFKDNFNFTPFSLACLRGHMNIIDYMFRTKKPLESLDLDDGLHRASESGHVEILQFLLENGASVNSVNSYGESALAIASKGQLDAVSKLISYGAKMNTMDNREYTALQLSLLRDQIDIATLLILHGADLHTRSTVTDSPLQLAVGTSNPIIVKYLIQAGCNINRERWFTPRIIEEKIHEFDFQSPGHLRFRWESDMQKDVWKWLKDNFHKPRCLRDVARIVIRATLVEANRGISIQGPISTLPLPNPLKKFLTFEDILQE